MTVEELKAEIAEGVQIPGSLLTGETGEEVIAQAKALLAYKREHTQEPSKSNREAFAEWVNSQIGSGEGPTDPAGEALARIEQRAKADKALYPAVNSSAPYQILQKDHRSPAEKFGEMLLNNISAW